MVYLIQSLLGLWLVADGPAGWRFSLEAAQWFCREAAFVGARRLSAALMRSLRLAGRQTTSSLPICCTGAAPQFAQIR